MQIISYSLILLLSFLFTNCSNIANISSDKNRITVRDKHSRYFEKTVILQYLYLSTTFPKEICEI